MSKLRVRSILPAAGQQLHKHPPVIPLLQNTVTNFNSLGIESLLPEQFPVAPSPEFLDLTFTLHIHGHHSRAQPFCVQLVLAAPQLHRGFLRLADAVFKQVHRVLRQEDRGVRAAEWGTLVSANEADGLPHGTKRSPERGRRNPISNVSSHRTVSARLEQMDIVMRLVDDPKNSPLLVHGITIACSLVAYGFRPIPDKGGPKCTLSDAVAELRIASWATSPVVQERTVHVPSTNAPGHPTLLPGDRVCNAADETHKVFVRPRLREGFKAIIIVSSDDIFADPSALTDPGTSSSQKGRRANLGLPLSADRSQILLQSRSHYVGPSTHGQFKNLGGWIEYHREELLQVLGRDQHFGDRSSESWADRRTLCAMLAPTSIQLVRVLYEGKMPPDADLRKTTQMRSGFWDGPVEEIYVYRERVYHCQVEGNGSMNDR
ncbi:hypothetical protein B0H10DRAFT_1946708 [Mycena sp. CBHHK59/15]|nr:hypothetical protein B0H10DRAFT_1946708 [Mycena sp. CBHHK59/15]